VGVDLWWYLEVNELARQTPWLRDVFAAYALWGGLVVLAGMLVAAIWWAVDVTGRCRRCRRWYAPGWAPWSRCWSTRIWSPRRWDERDHARSWRTWRCC